MMMKVALVLATLVASAYSETYFVEKFDDGEKWADRWTKSTWKEDASGEFVLTAPKYFAEEEDATGIMTEGNSKFFSLYAAMPKTVDTTGKDLVLQYSVKHEQEIDCGGGYIKLIPESSAMADFGGETPYSIMFGSDICGFGTKKVHVILTYKGTNYLIKKDIKAETDAHTHVYTLILKPTNEYVVMIDQKEVASGSLFDDFDFLPPRTIKDPSAVKPEDWDEEEKIADPAETKPENWDDIPATIADPEATKPEDWDEEEDGTWEPPVTPNPDYKGEWEQPMIENPAYKGKWSAAEIANPDFFEDDTIYAFKDLKYLGFELWQVKAGSLFDNIIVTDTLAEAEALAAATWATQKEVEKDLWDKASVKPFKDPPTLPGEGMGMDDEEYDEEEGEEEAYMGKDEL